MSSALANLTHTAKQFETPHGTLTVYPRCPPGSFEGLHLDSGLGTFAHYSSIIQRFDVFDQIAAGQDGRVTLAVKEGRASSSAISPARTPTAASGGASWAVSCTNWQRSRSAGTSATFTSGKQ